MANVNKPSGLSPVQYLNGAPWNGQARLYSVAASYGSVVAIGDPVDMSGTADVNGVPGVVLATAGNTNPILGAVVGIGRYEGGIFNPSNLDQIYHPASDANTWFVMVADDPSILFEVQDVGTGTPLAAVDVGLNVDLVAGTYNGYVSGWLLNNAAKAVTATYQMRLMGLVRRQDNVIGQYGKWLCKINLHRLADGSVGI